MDKKRVRDEEDETEDDSPEVKRLRENLLSGLDDESEFCNASQDLDSFMKSFEEEIAPSPSDVAGAADASAVDDSGESRTDLGYLLEASDDELGIPPPPPPPPASSDRGNNEITAEVARDESGLSDFGAEFWDMPSFDPLGLGFGFGETDKYNCEYVALDGLFERSDPGIGSGDFSHRPESLPAQ